MSGQLLLLLLTSVLASDDSSLNGAEKQQTHVSQVDMFSASVVEDSKSKKKAVAPKLSETQKSMMNHLELADNWTFWYQDDSDQDSTRDALSSEEWIQTLEKMESFRNYGQFLNQVKTFKTKVPLRIYLFKNNIRPLWEDEPNKDGGRLLISLPEERDPARAFESFLKVAVKVMCSDVGARVNGATFAYRPECGATTISVWTPLVWTPQRNKEEFNRFKRLVYEENNNSSSLKILFRPHKTYSVNPKGNSAPASSARRPYRQQGTIRPPPGFEGSALSGQWRYPDQSEAEKAAPIVIEDLEAKKSLELAKQKEAEEEALRQKQAEEEALRKKQQEEEEEEERQRILLLEKQKKEKEEARARKLARRQRQKENRKKRQVSSRSDSSSDEEDMSEEEEPSLPAPAYAAPIIEEEVAPIAPIASSPSAGYSRYLLPAIATLSTVVLAGVPLALQYLS